MFNAGDLKFEQSAGPTAPQKNSNSGTGSRSNIERGQSGSNVLQGDTKSAPSNVNWQQQLVRAEEVLKRDRDFCKAEKCIHTAWASGNHEEVKAHPVEKKIHKEILFFKPKLSIENSIGA